MKAVIQCAASKDPDAGYFCAGDGKPVKFFADPLRAPRAEGCIHARPDDADGTVGASWRDLLAEYNRESARENRFGLFPAYRLYLNSAYGDLVEALGTDNVYVLSAGWGLIRSDFLTPQYDITFSGQAEPYKRRRRGDVYGDFRHLDGSRPGLVLWRQGLPPIVLRTHRGLQERAYCPLGLKENAKGFGLQHLVVPDDSANKLALCLRSGHPCGETLSCSFALTSNGPPAATPPMPAC